LVLLAAEHGGGAGGGSGGTGGGLRVAGGGSQRPVSGTRSWLLCFLVADKIYAGIFCRSR
jgi:hypothetical protein